MSYCRFSCDGFRSEVYVYADCQGGYAVHVAGNRIKDFSTAPKTPKHIFDKELTHEVIENYIKEDRTYNEWLRTAQRVDIDDEYAGESFMFDTGKQTGIFLTELITRGYYIPSGVIDSLMLEQDDVPFMEDDLK